MNSKNYFCSIPVQWMREDLSIRFMIVYFIPVTLLFFYVAILLYYRWGWSRLRFCSPSAAARSSKQIKISVIIVARNEEKNIIPCLKSVFGQSYPPSGFEVLMVDDHSTDGTIEMALSFGDQNIKVIRLQDYTGGTQLNSYKKLGIEIAVGNAKGEMIVATDADCIVPATWLETLSDCYIQSGDIFLAAPVVFSRPLPGDSIRVKLFKIFQSLDFMTLQGITGASIGQKFHNMCNGANIAYSKVAFLEVDGFAGIDDIASGDDMLLMHKVQKTYPGRIGFVKSKDATVETKPVDTMKEFFNQRIRWASKAERYTDYKITAVLWLVYLFNLSLLILAVFSFSSLTCLYIFSAILVCKIAGELAFLFPVAKFFNRQQQLWLFVPAQPFHILYIVFAGWLGKFGSYKWKGRKVK